MVSDLTLHFFLTGKLKYIMKLCLGIYSMELWTLFFDLERGLPIWTFLFQCLDFALTLFHDASKYFFNCQQFLHYSLWFLHLIIPFFVLHCYLCCLNTYFQFFLELIYHSFFSQRISAKDALDSEYFWTDPLPCDPKRYHSHS